MTEAVGGLQRDELLKEYVSHIPLLVSEVETPFVIGMVGLVCAGKSTVAKALAERTGVYIASNDAIRRFLNKKGFSGGDQLQEMLQYIAERLTTHLLEHRVSHIIDNDLLKFHAQARAKIEAQGFRFYILEVLCPEPIILQRLETRSKNLEKGLLDSFSTAGIETYKIRKKVHANTPRPVFDFTVYTNRPLASQIDGIMKLLEEA